MITQVVERTIDAYTGGSIYPEEWDWVNLLEKASQLFLPLDCLSAEELAKMHETEVRELILEKALAHYEQREKEVGTENMREIERLVTLRVVDQKWQDHLDAMDQLRQGIGLRAMDKGILWWNINMKLMRCSNDDCRNTGGSS